jgi:hypothetical protein
MAGYQEDKALKEYGASQKAEKDKTIKALKEFGQTFEPKTITNTEMQATEVPLTQGMNVPTSPFGTNEQVNQVAPNYGNQAPVQNMSGNTTQMNPVTTTSTVQPTMADIEKAYTNLATSTNNPKLLEDIYAKRYEKMMKSEEPIKLNAGDILIGKDYKPLYQAPNKPTAPVVRNMRMGTNEVTQQYDEKTGQWHEIARGPAFKPEPDLLGLNGGPKNNSLLSSPPVSKVFTEQDIKDTAASTGKSEQQVRQDLIAKGWKAK